MSSDKPSKRDARDNKENEPPRDNRSAKDRHVLSNDKVSREPKTEQASLQDKLYKMENKLTNRTEQLRRIGILPSDGRGMPDIQAYPVRTEEQAFNSRIDQAVNRLIANPGALNNLRDNIDQLSNSGHDVGDIPGTISEMQQTIALIRVGPDARSRQGVFMDQSSLDERMRGHIQNITQEASYSSTSNYARGYVLQFLQQMGLTNQT